MLPYPLSSPHPARASSICTTSLATTTALAHAKTMNTHTLLLLAFSAASCGDKLVTGTTDSGTNSGTNSSTGSGSTSEGTAAEGSTSTTGTLDILCEEAISKEECVAATPPEGMACAWLSIDNVAKEPNSDCTTLSSEERCYSGFVDVQSGGLGGGCSAQYLQTGPGSFDAYGGWECFRITSGDWATCIDQQADACACYTPG